MVTTDTPLTVYCFVSFVSFTRWLDQMVTADTPLTVYCPDSFVSFNRWLDQMTKMVTADTPLTGDETVSWAAYHASKQSALVDPSSVAITSLLPLFRDQANSVAMIRHSMDVIKTAVDILNPGQVPVITADQPLYTLAKQIQWNWPQTHGEDYFVILFAGFHIEKASFNTLGDLLDCSGWTEALVQAGVATPGTADSFIKAAHVTRTRWAHQVTASVLYLLRQEGYTQYCDKLDDGHVAMSVEEWCDTRADASPQFKFWSNILKLELEIMIYVRSLREGDFKLYVDALTKIAPWFFALGHTNYARWIPVHLRDMVALEDKHPDVFAEFMAGNFTVKKTPHAFSALAIDQAHEQNNASVKGDGGAVGLTENPAAFRRWMVLGPEMARVIAEFQATSDKRTKKTDFKHHEQTKHKQLAFARDVKSLSGVMREMGNPFCDDSSDLLVLDSRDLADPAVINTVRQIEKLGQEQYNTYVDERLVNQTKPSTDSIRRNNLPLFSRSPVREKSRTQLQVSSLKNDCNHEHVNDARKQLFTQKDQAIDALPPTQEALRQHIKRTAYQAGYCWGQMMVAAAEIPSPSEWGWIRSDTGWDVCWTTLPEATKACRQLLRGGCKKGCRGQCKCRKAALQCTALCHCGGQCARD